MAADIQNLGDGDWEVVITQAAIDNTAEEAVPLPFRKFRLLRIKAEKTAGSAATLQPLLGKVTNPSGTDIEFLLSPAAALVDENPVQPLRLIAATDNKIFYRPQPDAGADNNVTSILRVREGWVD